ncbi:hypothetical protein F0P96_11585 [Hymenobacter busanensis]|uniref:Uncharacterized protein n=1 Tax=Hymenobacter busanensis TaxID=2607656 RepID=A0A7L4ZWF5_9BACT|nr:hypothetical protein [Hymenobacter busanensis]KAA9332123.1 hypothetical protein F0P96_11585 [Hymenobacter busanensis]QHJ07538.1 hypothetical protein GUY19_09685 [Hymenobacter busanensis]
MPENPLAQLRTAAEAVRQQLQVNSFDEAAVQRLETFIEEQRPLLTKETTQGVVVALGAFLGECLVQSFKGEWASAPDGTTGVGIRGDLFFNPFFRVAMQLEKGLSESVVGFFASMPARLAEPPKKRGWI